MLPFYALEFVFVFVFGMFIFRACYVMKKGRKHAVSTHVCGERISGWLQRISG
jgi:hypothetical protein